MRLDGAVANGGPLAGIRQKSNKAGFVQTWADSIETKI